MPDDDEGRGTVKCFVGGLNYETTDGSLRTFFEEAVKGCGGEVRSATVVMDQELNESRGFGFVELDTQQTLQYCHDNLSGTVFEGRKITVEEAGKPGRGRRRGSGRGAYGYGRGRGSGGFGGAYGSDYRGGGRDREGYAGGSGGYGYRNYGGNNDYGNNRYNDWY